MDTNFKGEFALNKVRLRCLEKGFFISIPELDTRYDCIIDDKNKLYKVQIKYCSGTASGSESLIVVRLRTLYHKNKAPKLYYEENEIDAVVAYIPQTDKLYWLPPKEFIGKSTVHLRLDQPKNYKSSKIRMAENFLW